MAAHYGVAVIPARAYKPRDKAKAESGVLIAERWIIARLRDRRFCSLARRTPRSPRAWPRSTPGRSRSSTAAGSSLFEQLDRPALRPLPATRYEFATWHKARVNIDYHIVADKHYYSVPYQLARQQVDVRLSAATVEVFRHSRRVASHVRSHVRHGHTTDPAHMPESHRRHAEWTPARITEWAAKTGPATAALVAKILESRPHPEQGYRAALGIIRLASRYGAGPGRGCLRPCPAAALVLLPQRRVDPAHRPGPPAACPATSPRSRPAPRPPQRARPRLLPVERTT